MPPTVPGAAVATILCLYICFAFAISNAPLEDMPNHLARVRIIGDLLFDRGLIFGHWFRFHPTFAPYMAGDLLLMGLERCFGEQGAAAVWIAASVLLLPLGIGFALRTQGASRISAFAGVALALYLATDWFFVMGFLNYQLGAASAVFAYGWFIRARQSGGVRDSVVFFSFVLLCYVLHLSSLVFIVAIVGMSLVVSLIRREASIGRTVKLFLPPCILLGAHILSGSDLAFTGHVANENPSEWGTWFLKLRGLGAPAVRFSPLPETALFAMFLAAALLPVALTPLRSIRDWADKWIIAAMFVGFYFVMPTYANKVFLIDVRGLPYALVFLLFGGILSSGPRSKLGRVQFAMALLVACVNLAYLASQLLPLNSAMGRYKAIASEIPPGSVVLPIDTWPTVGRYRPFLHAGSYATSESFVLTPYLFASDENPPMSYFSYVRRDYAPNEYWYSYGWYAAPAGLAASGGAQSGGWPEGARKEIARRYQYILVTVPWDATRIPVNYQTVRSNDVAALLRVEP